MSRGITFVVAVGLGVVVVPGCSNLLGFHQPVEGVDAGPGGDGAPAADFTIQTALAAARVPAGSFDFIGVVITRGTGDAAPITVSAVQPPSGVTVTGATVATADTTGQVEITGTTALTIGSAFMLDLSATDGTHTHDVMLPTTVTGIPGTLDVTFGSGNTGFIDVALGTDVGIFNAIAVDGSNNIVAVGVEAQELGDTPEITILDPDGAITGQTTENPGSTTNGGEFYAVAISGTGRIVTAGISHNNNDSADPDEPFICGFTGSAVVDTTFDGANGFEFIDLGQDIQNNAMAVDSTNLVFETSSSQAYRIPASGGNLDPGWNNADGALAVGITATGPQSITADPTLHVYVVGQSGGHAVVERITEAGVIDTAFGSNGIVDLGIAGSAAAALVQSDHAVLVAGTTAGGNVVLFRVLSTGAFDTTFGSSGVAQPTLTVSGSVTVTGMTVQSDGKIVVAGNGSAEAVLARYLSDGTLDPTFGSGGAASIPAGLSPFIDGVALQSTGMIIIGGGNADQPHSNGLDGNGYVARVWF